MKSTEREVIVCSLKSICRIAGEPQQLCRLPNRSLHRVLTWQELQVPKSAGQSLPKRGVRATSALPSIATGQQTSRIGSFVPSKADVASSYGASMSGMFSSNNGFSRLGSVSGSSNSEAWALLQLIQFPADPQEV